MKHNLGYKEVRQLLLERCRTVGTETVALEASRGRVLAEDQKALFSIPDFEKSPYDGYALRAEDTAGASAEAPVTLTIVEEVPAGAFPTKAVTEGTAVKILTGAPIPQGADVVVPFERTKFTERTVTLFAPLKRRDNIVRIGEDVDAGTLLARRGDRVDLGIASSLACQGIREVPVYRRPLVGLIATGTELCEPGEARAPGQIYNSNRYSIQFALEEAGCAVRYLGLAGDETEKIAGCMEEALTDCDAVVLTGGVSVGDYDLTPAAMERIGADILGRGCAIKPGMACAFAEKNGKLLLGLSGNPASSVTTFYAAVLPVIRRLCGESQSIPPEVDMTLVDGFGKASRCTRLLRGFLDMSSGEGRFYPADRQGNVAISSMIGCNAMAIIPQGSGPVEAGTRVKGFLL